MRTPSELKAIYTELNTIARTTLLLSELDSVLVRRAESGALTVPLRFVEKNVSTYTVKQSLNTNIVEVFLPSTLKDFVISKLTSSGFVVTHSDEPFDFYNVSWSSATAAQYKYVANDKTIPKLKSPKPTLSIGGLEYMLTKPDIWVDFGNYVVPAYNEITLGIV